MSSETGVSPRWQDIGRFACGSAVLLPAFGAETGSSPDLAPNDSVGWISYGPVFISPPSGPRRVSADPAHPFHPHHVEISEERTS
jgi:hypothetical protein